MCLDTNVFDSLRITYNNLNINESSVDVEIVMLHMTEYYVLLRLLG